MSIESVSRALRLDDPRLSAVDRLVLIGVANHDGDGGAWPTLETLRIYAGVSEVRSVRRALARLEDLGYLRRHVNEGGDRRTRDGRRPNLYELRLPGTEETSHPGPEGPPWEDRGDLRGRTERSSKPSVQPSCEPSSTQEDPPSLLPALASAAARPSLPTRPEDDGDFQVFWALYGKVGPRLKAWEAWRKARRSGADPTAIIAGLDRWIQYWQSPGAAAVKWPQGWLNERRWEDDPPFRLAAVTTRAPQTAREKALAAVRAAAQRGGTQEETR